MKMRSIGGRLLVLRCNVRARLELFRLCIKHRNSPSIVWRTLHSFLSFLCHRNHRRQLENTNRIEMDDKQMGNSKKRNGLDDDDVRVTSGGTSDGNDSRCILLESERNESDSCKVGNCLTRGHEGARGDNGVGVLDSHPESKTTKSSFQMNSGKKRNRRRKLKKRGTNQPINPSSTTSRTNDVSTNFNTLSRRKPPIRTGTRTTSSVYPFHCTEQHEHQ